MAKSALSSSQAVAEPDPDVSPRSVLDCSSKLAADGLELAKGGSVGEQQQEQQQQEQQQQVPGDADTIPGEEPSADENEVWNFLVNNIHNGDEAAATMAQVEEVAAAGEDTTLEPGPEVGSKPSEERSAEVLAADLAAADRASEKSGLVSADKLGSKENDQLLSSGQEPVLVSASEEGLTCKEVQDSSTGEATEPSLIAVAGRAVSLPAHCTWCGSSAPGGCCEWSSILEMEKGQQPGLLRSESTRSQSWRAKVGVLYRTLSSGTSGGGINRQTTKSLAQQGRQASLPTGKQHGKINTR